MKKNGSSQSVRHPEADRNAHTVHLSCHAPEPKAVFVAGTFNDWKPDTAPLQRQSDGKWDVELPLAPGRYEYKFVVDGQWCCKPGSGTEDRGDPKCCSNDFGTMNRVLEMA